MQMRLPQHRYNEVWPEVMQDITKADISGEIIQRNGKVKIIPNQQVLVKQSESVRCMEKRLQVASQDLWSQLILQRPETCPYYGDW